MNVAVCLHGYFGTLSTGDFSTSQGGFKHIQQRVVDTSHKVDFYVHCWQPQMKEKVFDFYNPKGCIFEDQIDFKSVCVESGIHQNYIDEYFPRSRTMYKNATAERILSFYYSRCESIKLALKGGKYDWVLTTRFDISKRGGSEVNQIRFLSREDPSYLYTTDWNQKNAGYGDMWFYGSPDIMQRYSEIYKHALHDFRPMSQYERCVTTAWPDSNFFNHHDHNDQRQFTNEFDNEEKSKHLMAFPKWRVTDSHLHHKWFCMQTGLYQLTRWV